MLSWDAVLEGQNVLNQTGCYCGHGSEEVVKRLLNVVQRNIISARDTNGKTTLEFAARGVRPGEKNYEAVSKLLTEGRSARAKL